MIKIVSTGQGKPFTTSVVLQGSNDNSTWTDLKTINESDLALNTDAQYFIVNNKNKYRYYRLFGGWNANGAGTKLQFYGRGKGGVQDWLKASGITNKNYTTLSDISNDSTTLASLISNSNAIDYLVTAKGFIQGICTNSTITTFIGLNNDCSNSLINDNLWLKAIINSDYVDSILNVKIPTMTSNTTPSGECYATQGAYTGSTALWKMFDNDNSTNAEQQCQVGQVVGYKFPSSKKVLALVFGGLGWQQSNSLKINSFKIVASNDASTWEELSDTIDNTSYNAVTDRQIEAFANNNSYLYYGLKTVSQANASWIQATSIQFYGREDV